MLNKSEDFYYDLLINVQAKRNTCNNMTSGHAELQDRIPMSTTWFIAKEYLKRLEIDFEEHGRTTFSVHPEKHIETKVIEVFPGKDWITLTTRLMALDDLPAKGRKGVYEKLLKANATLVEVNFGIDKKNYLMLRNAAPVTGISYDVFNCTYEAHLAAIKFFFEKMKDQLFLE
jgi:hypothetical protein